MNKENCTKGPARVIQAQRGAKHWGLSIVTGTAPDEQSGILADLSGHYRNERTRADVLPNTEANAELIAEAFNVLAETGMTPRELVRALRRLYGASGCIDGMLDGDRDKQEAWEDEVSELDRARAEANLILTHQPVTPA